MKILYSEIFKKPEFSEKALSELEKLLPEKFFLAYIIQYKPLALKLKKQFKNRLAGFSQVLGCSKIKPQKAVLLLEEGRFHALNLLKYSEKVVVFNSQGISELGIKEKQEIENREKIKLSSLLHYNSIGILISSKQGQYNILEAVKAKNKLSEMKKQAYFFLFDTLNPAELENFGINFWVNTACPGLEHDFKGVINSQSLFQIS